MGKHGKPAAVVAHSLGSAATAVAVLDGLPAARLVFVAPSTKLSDGLALLQRTLGFGERTRTRMLARMGRLAGRPLADFDITGLSRRQDVELPPTLVVHDRNDKEVPYDDGAELAATWPGGRARSHRGARAPAHPARPRGDRHGGRLRHRAERPAGSAGRGPSSSVRSRMAPTVPASWPAGSGRSQCS